MPIIKVINNYYMDAQALMNVINYVRKGPLEGGYAIESPSRILCKPRKWCKIK